MNSPNSKSGKEVSCGIDFDLFEGLLVSVLIIRLLAPQLCKLTNESISTHIFGFPPMSTTSNIDVNYFFIPTHENLDI